MKKFLFAFMLIAASLPAYATYLPMPQRSYVYPPVGTAASGFSATIPDGVTIYVINSSAGLLTGTITLPANPIDGQAISIEAPKGITALTTVPNTGQFFSNNFNITALGINTPARVKYSGINFTWYPN